MSLTALMIHVRFETMRQILKSCGERKRRTTNPMCLRVMMSTTTHCKFVVVVVRDVVSWTSTSVHSGADVVSVVDVNVSQCPLGQTEPSRQ